MIVKWFFLIACTAYGLAGSAWIIAMLVGGV